MKNTRDQWRTTYKTGGGQQTQWTRCCSNFGQPYIWPLTPYNCSNSVKEELMRHHCICVAMWNVCHALLMVIYTWLYPACIRDPAFINVKLYADTRRVLEAQFIRGRCLIEEIQYLYQTHHTASLVQAQSFAKDHAFRCTLQWTWKMLYTPEW